MALDVKVKIDLTYPVGTFGFGYPLILTVGEAKDYDEYTNVEDVVTAGFEATTDVYKAATLMFNQKNPPEKVAVCGVAATTDLTAIKNKAWRQLVAVGAETADITALLAYVNETEDKMLFATVEDAAGLATFNKSDRVVGFVHSDELAVAALAGEVAGRKAGSFTYKNLILEGIEPMEFTDAELKAISEAGGITFVTKAGDNVTSDGVVTSGEFADIVDSKDWIIQQIGYETQKVFNTNGKVSFDNNGIAMLESAAVNVLQEAYTNGMIATNEDGSPAYTVSYALNSQVSDADRAARKYKGGQFTFKLAGAVHEAEVTGEIII